MGLYDRHYYHDDLQPLRTQWDARSMVTLIIIVNAAIQLINLVLGRDNLLNQFLWLHANDLQHPLNWYRFLTYGFAHSQDITHVLFNMLSLFFLGQAVEQKYGRGEFLRIYLISIVTCGLVWAVMKTASRDSSSVLLGASGAVTTICMLFVFSFPHAVLRIWGVVPVKAWVLGILIIGGNLLGNSQVTVGNRTQIAYDVHLIGARSPPGLFLNWNFGSLEVWYSRVRNFRTSGRSRLKVHHPDAGNRIPAKTQAEADRILDKIHRHGQDSLSSREREFMEDYSRQVRRQRTRSRS